MEYAKILDYYGVPWMYEPHTFVLERAEDGRVTEAFTPDFYLPEQDLYLEVTVMKQSLVTRKNRKLRKLRNALPRRPDQAVLRARLRANRVALRPAQGFVTAQLDRAHRRGLPRSLGDRGASAGTRRRGRARLRRPRAAARRRAEGLRAVRRPTSRWRSRSPTRSTSSSSPGTGRPAPRGRSSEATSRSGSSRTSTSRSADGT